MSILTQLKCPVFKAEGIPRIDENTYILRVDGMVKAEKEFSVNALKSLPFSRISSLSHPSVVGLFAQSGMA